MSQASFSLSSTICSLDSSTSIASTVKAGCRMPGRKSSVWHIVSRSTITSIGPARRRVEVHLPVAVQVVETAVRLAAAALQVGGDVLAALGQAGEVHVLARPQPRREVRADDAHGQAAEQLEAQAGLGRAPGQAERLGQRVVRRAGGGRRAQDVSVATALSPLSLDDGDTGCDRHHTA